MERLMRASRPSLGVGSRTDGIALRRVASRERRSGYGPMRLGIRSGVTLAALPESTGAVDLFVDRAIDFIRTSGDVSRQVLDIIQRGEQIVERVLPVVVEATQKAAPVAQRVTQGAVDVSSTAATAAAPVVQSALKSASDVLAAGGVDVGEVQSTTQSVVRTASDVAAPAVKSSFDFVTTTNPVVLGYFALAAVGVYLFGPGILSFAINVSRGYAGDITAAGALDSVLNSANAFLIDIRTPGEKERAGVLVVPGNVAGNLIEVEFAVTANRRLRDRMTDPQDVECRVTALQIAALRRLSRASKLFLLDANGSMSRAVAKKLKGLGFKNCFVVTNGYSGWMRAKLQTKPSLSVYRAEVVGAGPVLGTVFGGGTMQRRVTTTTGSRRVLPPGK